MSTPTHRDDESAIRELAFTYADAVSRLDAAAAIATYAEDGVLSAFYGPPIEGRAEITAALGRMLGALEFLSHSCSNGLIRVEGDRAVARWNVTEWIRRRDDDALHCCFGLYEDDLRRGDEGWSFARRRFHPLYRGPVSGEGKLYRPPTMELSFE